MTTARAMNPTQFMSRQLIAHHFHQTPGSSHGSFSIARRAGLGKLLHPTVVDDANHWGSGSFITEGDIAAQIIEILGDHSSSAYSDDELLALSIWAVDRGTPPPVQDRRCIAAFQAAHRYVAASYRRLLATTHPGINLQSSYLSHAITAADLLSQPYQPDHLQDTTAHDYIAAYVNARQLHAALRHPSSLTAAQQQTLAVWVITTQRFGQLEQHRASIDLAMQLLS